VTRSPAVSVCIRASDRPPGLLRDAIESVLAQSFGDFEVVVSDDSNRHAGLVRAFGDPRVRYHANPRPAGSLANMKRVLGLARAPLIGLLDDDDVFLPDFLASAVEPFRRHSDLGVVFADHYLEVSGHRMPRRPPVTPGRHDDFLPQLLEHCCIALCSALMRREVWEQCQRELPLRTGEIGDATIWVSAAQGGWAFHYVDRPLGVWRLHPGQMSWGEAAPAKTAATFERFRFSDPVSERLRRARLAEARAAQAGVHLRRRQPRRALAELARARRAAPKRLGARELLAFTGARPAFMRLAARHPRALTAGAPIWRRVRPPVVRSGT
jgi:Glycosyl transferase family 2